jgi:hypothetical protein
MFPIWPAELDLPPYNKSRVQSDYEHSHDHEDPINFWGRPRQPHPDLFELDTPEYAGRLRKEWVVERLMAMAGVRLAGLLNGLFMDEKQLEQGSAPIPLVPLHLH